MNEPKKTCGTCWYRTDAGGWESVCGRNPPRAIPICHHSCVAVRYVPYQLTVDASGCCEHYLARFPGMDEMAAVQCPWLLGKERRPDDGSGGDSEAGRR
jgi:hypothetical protein